MRTNLRLAFITTLLAALMWSAVPGCASMSKTTHGASSVGVAGGR